MEDVEKVQKIVEGLPEVFSIKSIERLGGLTNVVYRVATDKRDLCVRIPGAGTEAYINRHHEARAARETARVGVSAPVLHFDDVNGECVTAFISGAVTMSPEEFGKRQGAAKRAGEALQRLHSSDATFENRFDVFALIDNYLSILRSKNASVPQGYNEVLASAEKAREALQANPVPLAPCHCDPLSENFLDAGDKMWIVDWEYSGMNDPLWDIGDFSVEASLSAENEAELISGYFGRPASAAEGGRIVIYKALCDLVWTLWGLIQHANNNPAEDFWAYSMKRFERCSELMATPRYREAVAAVASI
jgi:thiamine kinase-like enzyme